MFSAAFITQYLHNFMFSTLYIPWMLMYSKAKKEYFKAFLQY